MLNNPFPFYVYIQFTGTAYRQLKKVFNTPTKVPC